MVKKDEGSIFWVCLEAGIRHNVDNHLEFRVALSNITKLKQAEEALQKALHDEIKTLRGILPICANCKKIRDDQGYWNQIEIYVRDHSEVVFSHGICPDCANKLYPDLGVDFGRTPQK